MTSLYVRGLGCTCKKVLVGGEETGSYNVDPDCPDHGVGTHYWNTKIKATSDRAVEMQRQAREARARHRAAEEGLD